MHPCLHIGRLTKTVSNNGWHTTGNCSRQLGCCEKEATQILHSIVYVNCLSLPPRQWVWTGLKWLCQMKMQQTCCVQLMGLVTEVLMLSNKSHLFSIIRTMITQSVMDTCRASLYQKTLSFEKILPYSKIHTIDGLTMVHCAGCNSGVAPLIRVWYWGRILVCQQIMRRRALVEKTAHYIHEEIVWENKRISAYQIPIFT